MEVEKHLVLESLILWFLGWVCGIMVRVVLDERQVELLRRARDLIDELLETLEVASDGELMEGIKEAEEDIKAGRIRDYDEMIKKLKEVGEI